MPEHTLEDLAPAGGAGPILIAERITKSGTALHIRPGTPDDEDGLADMFQHVSPDDLRFRFGSSVGRLSHQQIAALVQSASLTVITFLAFLDDGTLAAAATLADAPDGASAEVAVSVRTQWRDHGIAWTLLEHSLAYAAAHGLKEVTSLESGDDRAAVKLECEMGFVARLTSASPVELSLSKIVGQQ